MWTATKRLELKSKNLLLMILARHLRWRRVEKPKIHFAAILGGPSRGDGGASVPWLAFWEQSSRIPLSLGYVNIFGKVAFRFFLPPPHPTIYGVGEMGVGGRREECNLSDWIESVVLEHELHPSVIEAIETQKTCCLLDPSMMPTSICFLLPQIILLQNS